MLPQLDGLTATMVDEAILMREPLLKHYWSSVVCFLRAHCEDMIRGNTDALQVGHNIVEAHMSVLCSRHYCSVAPSPWLWFWNAAAACSLGKPWF